MNNLSLYESVAARTNGDIYIGVTGPVRTGKSTFIRRFMDLFVLPNIEDEYARQQIVDEMPQSGSGRTITTTEPKFIPAEAVPLTLPHNTQLRVRMVDCVGFIVPEAIGHKEDGVPRMVHTPWSEDEMPFEAAAEMGTHKVITDHSTIGIMVTTDGSIGSIPRSQYIDAEAKTVDELHKAGRPFAIILNSTQPDNDDVKALGTELSDKYNAPVVVADCMKMSGAKIDEILTSTLYQFPVMCVNFELPGFVDGIDCNHWLKDSLIRNVRSWSEDLITVENVIKRCNDLVDKDIISDMKVQGVELATGTVTLHAELQDGLFYRLVEEITGTGITDHKDFFGMLKNFAEAQSKYSKLESAMEQVEATGYGIVQPKLTEMTLQEPEIFKQGNKYGIRLTAKAPSLHIIKTDITTEISPVVGTEGQSEDLMKNLLSGFEADPEGIWNTNFFGKSLQEMVTEQMETKLSNVPENIRDKVQKSLQKISDEGKEYFICIVI